MPQKLRCEVARIQDHGEGVYSVFLKPETPAPRFLPGQFLHLALDEYRPGDFWPDSRSFSIASSPAERDLLSITFAVKGLFTGRMQKELTPGKQVWVKLPFGEFTIQAGQDVCLLAGGTGVTAFTGFLAGLAADHPNRVAVFYGARRPDLLIYRPLIEEAARRCPQVCAVYLAEEHAGPDSLPGRIEAGLVLGKLSDPAAYTFYLAGPPAMLQALSAGLTELGVPRARLRVDAWE
jgi:ferredoxin-NADP reductase